MKLKPTMFYDPEPKIEEFKIDHGYYGKTESGLYKEYEYKQSHTEWSRRQVNPNATIAHNKYRGEWLEHDFDSDEEARIALQYYEENRLRWADFSFEWYYDTLRIFIDTIHFDFEIKFHQDGQLDIHFTDSENSEVIALFFMAGLSVSLFEQICSENGIELKDF